MLVADVTHIFAEPENLEKMSTASAALGVKDAATRVCTVIERA
jgi:UDP-N-acetylglucosamine:LPS N-acetylglucosamine transferase